MWAEAATALRRLGPDRGESPMSYRRIDLHLMGSFKERMLRPSAPPKEVGPHHALASSHANTAVMMQW